MGNEKTTPRGSRALFEFDCLTLDTRQCVLFRGAERLPLPKLTYELLLALAGAAPGLLTHQQLAERVWPGRFVTPETLAQRVMLLRRALGDDARNPRYVRGVRGQGYQLIPVVRVRSEPDGPASLPMAAIAERSSERPDGDASFVDDIDLSLPAQPSIVVLPFATVDEDVEHRNFARGLTHDVMTRIARTRSFFVVARGSAFRFEQAQPDPREVGRKLGVRYVLQGHVQFADEALVINVALADSVECKEIWAERFHSKLGDLFDTQEEMTDLIVGAIESEVDHVEQRRALLEKPANLDAWSAYHRACWHMYRFTPRDYEWAKRYFDLSVRLDPNSSRTLAGLSFVHWQRAFLEISRDRTGEIQRAFELAQESVSLNPRDPLGHWALGRAYLLRGQMSESIAELNASTDLNPSFAVGQYTLGLALMYAGDTVHSIERADKARRLSPYDPLSFAMIGVRGFSLALTERYDESAKVMAIATRQLNAHYQLVAMAAVCDALAGNDESARTNVRRLSKARPGYDVKDFLRAFPFQQEAHTKLVLKAFRRLARLH
jgi:TolB-like protein/DNA-binding winged helix-turn-helix (wHTH) protein